MENTQHRFSPYQTGCLSILFASILWGTTGTVASFAPEISPLAIGAFSMGVGGIFQACLAFNKLKQDLSKLVLHKQKLITSALALAVYPLAFYTSMRLAGVAVGTVISIASAPFFTVLIEYLFSKDRKLTKQWFLSFILGMFGVVMLVLSESTLITDSNSSSRLLGISLGFLAGLAYGIYSWVAKAMIDEGIQSQAAMGSIFGLGAIFLIPTLAFTGSTLFSTSNNTLVLCYMALIPMGLGYIAFGFGLRYVKASSANLLTLLEPIIAAILAVLIVGESITLLGWTGILLIMLCLLLQYKS